MRGDVGKKTIVEYWYLFYVIGTNMYAHPARRRRVRHHVATVLRVFRLSVWDLAFFMQSALASFRSVRMFGDVRSNS